MFRKMFAKISLFAALLGSAAPLGAACNEGYVKLYNYTDSCLQIYVDGTLTGNVPTGTSPAWLPVEYGLHKVEVYKQGRGTYKYCEVSYSYPNAELVFYSRDI